LLLSTRLYRKWVLVGQYTRGHHILVAYTRDIKGVETIMTLEEFADKYLTPPERKRYWLNLRKARRVRITKEIMEYGVFVGTNTRGK
jgi:hypothetical protein